MALVFRFVLLQPAPKQTRILEICTSVGGREKRRVPCGYVRKSPTPSPPPPYCFIKILSGRPELFVIYPGRSGCSNERFFPGARKSMGGGRYAADVTECIVGGRGGKYSVKRRRNNNV